MFWFGSFDRLTELTGCRTVFAAEIAAEPKIEAVILRQPNGTSQ